MGRIIATGVSLRGHQFSVEYSEERGKVICMAKCKCGYEVKILNSETYGGVKELEWRWKEHVK